MSMYSYNEYSNIHTCYNIKKDLGQNIKIQPTFICQGHHAVKSASTNGFCNCIVQQLTNLKVLNKRRGRKNNIWLKVNIDQHSPLVQCCIASIVCAAIGLHKEGTTPLSLYIHTIKLQHRCIVITSEYWVRINVLLLVANKFLQTKHRLSSSRIIEVVICLTRHSLLTNYV